MKTIDIKFKGYEWDAFGFPTTSGVYGIYKAVKNKDGGWIVGRLVYIGKSDNLNRRIKEHARSDYPSKGKYCYIYCELTEYQSKLAEAAIVSECQPEGNSDFMDGYPKDYEPVYLNITGMHREIPATIER